MQLALAIIMGVGLAAACGFRVFVPMLIVSIAVRAGQAHVAPNFAWLGSDAAIIAFSLATVLEVAAYYVPLLGHLLDVIATPAAVVAGTIITASFITDMSPQMRWTLAVIAGGGAAGVVQAGTVALRAVTTATTGGLGHPVVATFEAVSAITLSVLAVVVPVVVVLVLVGLPILAVWLLVRRRAAATATPTS